MSLASGLRKLRERSPAQQRLLLETILQLAWACAMVRLLPFRRIATLCKLVPGEDCPALNCALSQVAAQVGSAVEIAAARTPWQSACLGQALAGAALLRRRGIPGTLYLGVAREGTPSKSLAAHAWLRCGDVIVTGSNGHERFAIVGRFRWR